MIDISLYFTFIAAVAALMLVPGPNVALIIANSIAYGSRFGLLTVAGTSFAMVVQLALVGLGMTRLLGEMGIVFETVRWIGVAYLIYLGVLLFRTPAADLASTFPESNRPQAIFVRALVVSLTNPKTLLFYGAFFPQFVIVKAPIAPQIAILSVTFLVLAVGIDSGWALLAGRSRRLIVAAGNMHNRISGMLLIGSGVALALARNK
jgi:threonine/homoserine/homoserine lactone efflux protein